MNDEIKNLRGRFEEFIILQDITLQRAAELVGWKRAASVTKFLAGKHAPNKRRLYRIQRLLAQQSSKGGQS